MTAGASAANRLCSHGASQRGQCIGRARDDTLRSGANAVATALPFIQQGRVMRLEVTARNRFLHVSDVLTIAAGGLPGCERVNWIGLVAPVQTPRAIVVRLSEAVAAWARNPDDRAKRAAVGFEIEAGTPEDFDEFLRSEHSLAGKVMASLGVKRQ